MKLAVDEEELASCVACGLCLPHCPTFRVTGEEAESPRGRIAAMRIVDTSSSRPDAEFATIMDHCVQCRGCEAACPSGVPFGRLMEGARQSLAAEMPGYQPRWRRLAYSVLGHHRILLAGTSAMAIAQRMRLLPTRLGVPRLPIKPAPLLAISGDAPPDAWLFPGCVMDAWMRPIHQAVLRVMRATGARVSTTGSRGGCCGALHMHAGLVRQARNLASRVMESAPGHQPIVVDSAGCGATMKAYGEWLGTPAAQAFSERVVDASEWLAGHLAELPPPRRNLGRVAVQDPCHLRHVQAAHQHVRQVLQGCAELVELDDDGLCCGAGGVYSALHPEMAAKIRELKLFAVQRSGATLVASGNPGCIMHLSAGGLEVLHPLEVVDRAMSAHGPNGP